MTPPLEGAVTQMSPYSASFDARGGRGMMVAAEGWNACPAFGEK